MITFDHFSLEFEAHTQGFRVNMRATKPLNMDFKLQLEMVERDHLMAPVQNKGVGN